MLGTGFDAIDICLPSQLHRQYVVEALNNGKHVFCETPVCFDLEDVEAMKRAEEQSGKRILVNQFIKFDPAYKYLQEAYHQQKYRKLLSLTLKRKTSPMWGDLGLNSITTNLMIHELDFLTWLFGPIDKFTAWGTQSENKQQALVRVFFQLADTFTEVIVSSQMPGSYPFTVGYEAYFEKAKLVFHESDTNTQTTSAIHEYNASGNQELVLENANPYQKSIEHAVQCFHDDTDSFISLDHATQSLKIAIQLKKMLVN